MIFIGGPILIETSQTLCAKARNVPRNGYLQNWAETTYAFERVHMDICYIDGVSYMVIIDSFSKFVNVVRTRSRSSADVIAALLSTLSTFKFCGLPTCIISDNATVF